MNVQPKTMSLLLGLAVLLSNSVLANGQAPSKNDGGYSGSNEYGDGVYFDGGADFDKRMSALHVALKLLAGQEKAWTEFSGKIKSVKMDKPEQQDWTDMSTPDRLYQMLDNMKSHENNMAEHAATVRAFYVALTEVQKKVFDKHFQERHARHSRVNK